MKLKKVTALALLCAMLVSMASCNNNNNGSSQQSSGSSSSGGSSSSASSGSSSSEAGTPDDSKELYEFTMMGNLTQEMTDNDRAYIKGLEDALNLKINVEIPPSTSYGESIQMMLASGEYADLVLFGSATDTVYVDAVRNGVFIPLDDYLANSPNLQKYSYDVSFEALKVLKPEGDDHIYGIPRTSITRADGYFIRKDWLDNLNIEFTEGPMTLDTLEEIARRFTFDDPDGNGANDTYGIAACSDSDGNMGVLFAWAFGLTGWMKHGDEYIDPMYSKDMDNYKRALTWTNKMWEAGLIDPDAPTVQRDVEIERFQKGITGIHGEFAGWLTDNEVKGQALNPDFKIAYITSVLENEGDTPQGGSFSTGFWGCWSVASTAEKPERIVEMMDYILSDDYWDNTKYGMEGYAWNEENGVKVATDSYSSTAMGRAILRRNDDAGFFVALNQSAEERTRVEDLIQVCINQHQFTEDNGFRPTISDDPTFIDYQKSMQVQITKIIVGDLPVDEWDAILDGWYKAGGEQYIQEMQAAIKARKGE